MSRALALRAVAICALAGSTAAGPLACATDSAPDPPSAESAAENPEPAAAETADAADAWQGDPDVPEDSPYADLRAQLEQQRESGGDSADPLAPLREGLAREADAQIEAQRWNPNRPPAPSNAPAPPPTDPALAGIAAEIAADEALRRQSEEAKRLRQERKQQVEAEVRKARFEVLEQAPLRNCVPSSKHLDQLPGSVIRHRQLLHEDFLAEAVHENLDIQTDDEDFEPGAHVSVSIACITVIRIKEPAADTFEARLYGLRYVALLDRNMSWWNSEADHISEEWTLRHEQVHFDLAEVEARRLTRGAGALQKQLVGRGTTPEGAVADLQGLWDAHMEEVRIAFRDLEMSYDRETAHGRNLSKQTEWFTRAKRGLAESRSSLGS